MRLALLFSGQGQQTVDHLTQLKNMADEPLSTALANALGPVWTNYHNEELTTNQIAQPLVFGFEMGWWQLLKDRLPMPICAAGYSLGELSACAAVGLFSPEVGVGLCLERARLMDVASPQASSMLAVLGLRQGAVHAIIDQHNLAIAIRNSPTHFVIAGAEQSIVLARDAFEKSGATKLIALAVKTPSHTHFLASASEKFVLKLEEIPGGRFPFPVISASQGGMGRLIFTHSEAAKALSSQISSMLDWEAAMHSLIEMRPDVVLEIGPGNALSKMFTEIAPEIPVRSVCDFKTMDGVINWVSPKSSIS